MEGPLLWKTVQGECLERRGPRLDRGYGCVKILGKLPASGSGKPRKEIRALAKRAGRNPKQSLKALSSMKGSYGVILKQQGGS